MSTAKLILLLLSLLFLGFYPNEQHASSLEFEKNTYKAGEILTYRLHYGILTAGYGIIAIEDKLYQVGNRTCYNASIFGKSTGTVDMMFKVRDTWRSFIDTASYAPQKSFRNIEEGRYRLREEVFYDEEMNIAKVLRKQPDRNQEEFEYKIPHKVQDIVSGLYQLRSINFNKLSIGDTFTLKAFFDKENYNFSLRYMGKGKANTQAGKFNAIKIVPIMPPNRLFKGEESVKIWLSDDKNKIPVLAEVEMFVGTVKLELTSYKGLKNEVSVKQ